MSTDRDFERITSAWLTEGPNELADRVLDTALDEVHMTHQRRALRVPWRFPQMNTISRIATVAAVAVIAVAGGVYLIGPALIGGTGPIASTVLPSSVPTSTAGSTSTPGASAGLLPTTGWTPYTSARYGFTMAYPPGWTVAPSNHTWTWALDGTNYLSTGQDAFIAPDGSIRVSAWTVPGFISGTTDPSWADVERWAIDYCSRSGDSPCTGIHERAVPLCIETRDCHPALLVRFNTDVLAFGIGGVLGPEMTVVAVWRPEFEPSVAPYGGSATLLETFLSTMNVWRADASLDPNTVGAAAAFMAASPSP
jgi:hypothetical protein